MLHRSMAVSKILWTLIAGSCMVMAQRDKDLDPPRCVKNRQCTEYYRKLNWFGCLDNFALLLDADNHLALNCSQEVRTAAAECSADDLCLTRSGSIRFLPLKLRSWNYFCSNQALVESVSSSCYSKVTFRNLDGCPNRRRHGRERNLNCVEDTVSAMPECGEVGGLVFRGLMASVL